MSLPCIGWFDDCENVLKILETFRNARINGNKVKIKGQSKTVERTLTANSVKIGDIDYAKIRLIYKPKTEDNSFDPTDYNSYDQQFFVEDGSVDWQHGFVYNKDNKELFKIIIDDEASKIGSLKEYLFGENSGTDEQEETEIHIEQILADAETATQIGSKYTSGTACNICIRAALYIIKKDSASKSSFHCPCKASVISLLDLRTLGSANLLKTRPSLSPLRIASIIFVPETPVISFSTTSSRRFINRRAFCILLVKEAAISTKD